MKRGLHIRAVRRFFDPSFEKCVSQSGPTDETPGGGRVRGCHTVKRVPGSSDDQKSYQEILQREIEEGLNQLNRPPSGLALSAVSAGLDIGFGPLLMAVALTLVGGTWSEGTTHGTDAGVTPHMTDADAEYELATTDHDRIQRWVDERDRYPAEAEGDGSDRPTALRLAFSESADASRLDWEEFFDRFDDENLAMAYRVAADETDGDAESARLVSADSATLTDDGDAEAAVADEREAARERQRERDLSETVDERSQVRSNEATDEANLDNHRDEPPYGD